MLHDTSIKAIGLFGFGITFKKVTDYFFDYIAYPAAIISLGFIWGGIVMVLSSIVLNLSLIRAYDWARQDFLFLEALKELKVDKKDIYFIRILKSGLTRGKFLTFILLSVLEDPVVATLYLRSGSNLYNGLSKSDLLNFIWSTIISNAVWILSIGFFVELYRFVARQF